MMMNRCLQLCLVISVISLTARAQDAEGWTTVLATQKDLKAFPEQQVSLEDGLLHVRAGDGILIPQPSPDGAIRGRIHFKDGTGFPQFRIRRTGDAKAKNTSYYEVIIFVRPGQTSVKEFYVNLTTRGKGKRIGTVPLPKPFAVGDDVDLELSVVGDLLQVTVDGKLAFSIVDGGLASGGYWGVAAQEAWFSNVQVRSLTPKPPKSADPRLVQLEEAYAAAIQREVTEPHSEALKTLATNYLAALDRASDAASTAGNLDGALALRTEKKSIEDGTPLPADDSTAAEILKPLRTTYRNAIGQLEASRDQRRQSLRIKFVQALGAYQDELTLAKNLDGALEVRKRKELEMESGKQPVVSP